MVVDGIKESRTHMGSTGSLLLYFIRILTSLSYNLSFYPQSKPNNRTQFTTAQRDVKEAFRRGQALADSPRSDRGHP